MAPNGEEPEAKVAMGGEARRMVRRGWLVVVQWVFGTVAAGDPGWLPGTRGSGARVGVAMVVVRLVRRLLERVGELVVRRVRRSTRRPRPRRRGRANGPQPGRRAPDKPRVQ